MSDDGFEEFLRRSAAEYHRPPAEVPREEMWTRIRAARAERQAPTRRSVVPIGGRRAWLVLAAGLAATLLVGVAIGRSTRTRPTALPSGQEITSTQRVAPHDTPVGEPALTQQPAPSRAVPGAGAAEVPQRVARPRTRQDGQRAPDVPQAAPNADAAYRLAVLQHLAQTDAMLTTYRTESVADAQLARWAGDLLSTTRLLIDSPAARDPQRRRLLEDLEIVLVQIVQLAPGAAVDDRASIDRALERGHVMTRLRAAPSSGSAASGT